MCILLYAVKSRSGNSNLWWFCLHIKSNIQKIDKRKVLGQYRRKQTVLHKGSQQMNMNTEETVRSSSAAGIL